MSNKRYNYFSFILVVVIISTSYVFAGRTIYIPDDYPSISEALANVIDDDTVIIRTGIYSGAANRNISFPNKKFTLTSEDPTNAEVVRSTIVDGEWKNRIFNIGYGGRETKICGLTIRRGYAVGSFLYAGGIYIGGASPTISRCVFAYNVGRINGGAITCWGSMARIENCIFVGNSVSAHGADGNGGGISCLSSSDAEILFCTFIRNAALKGGAIEIDSSSPIIRNCIMWGDAASDPQTSEIFLVSGVPSIAYCDIQDCTGKPWFGSGCIDKDPFLTQDGHLCTGSPCIDMGTTILPEPVAAGDRDGESRSSGIKPDIGADEFVDTDSDGLPSCWEFQNFGSISGAMPGDDPDGDYLTNIREYHNAINPNQSDTDFDGWPDGKEVRQASNPRCPNVYVNPTLGDDLYDGRSPLPMGGTSGPKQHIQQAIITAGGGETVILAAGSYVGSGNYDLDFSYGLASSLGKSGGRVISVQSENPFDPEAVAATVMDLQDNGRGFYLHGTLPPDAAVKGLTIRNGLISGNGGAIFCEQSSPTISHCMFENNRTTDGGHGGAIACAASAPLITDCTMVTNSAHEGGGAIMCYASWGYCRPTIRNCFLSGNTAGYGGGVYCPVSAGWGNGAILENCVISGNSATYDGGGLWGDRCEVLLRNCTVYGNSAASRGGGVYYYGNDGYFVNSIFWDNSPEQIIVFYGNYITVDYSVVQGGWSGAGVHNITNNPQFVSALPANFHLQDLSPCIDSAIDLVSIQNDIDFVPRPLDGDNNGTRLWDIGAYEFVHPVADSDGDLQSDSDEIISGTDASNPVSYFKIEEMLHETNGSQSFSWDTVWGRMYTVMFTTNLMKSWVSVPNAVDLQGTDMPMIHTNTFNETQGFYKVQVRNNQ